MLCVGLVMLTTGCPGPTPTPCTENAECDDGFFCNGDETCVEGFCQSGTNPCAADATCDEDNDICVGGACAIDADCAEGQFCDTQTGECISNVDSYGVIALDKDEVGDEEFNRVHGLHQASPDVTCTECHHAGIPTDPGTGSCRACHADDKYEDNSFYEVAHDLNESGDGCRGCHEDDFATCAYCHPALNDL